MARPAVVKDFILSQPRNMPIARVIKAAKLAKLGSVSKSYISKVRSNADKASPQPASARAVNGHAVPADESKRPVPASWAATLSTPALQPLADTELQLRRLFVVVGTERAQQLLDAYKAAAEMN